MWERARSKRFDDKPHLASLAWRKWRTARPGAKRGRALARRSAPVNVTLPNKGPSQGKVLFGKRELSFLLSKPPKPLACPDRSGRRLASVGWWQGLRRGLVFQDYPRAFVPLLRAR